MYGKNGSVFFQRSVLADRHCRFLFLKIMDDQFTKDIQKWLSNDEASLEDGAMMLLRLNRNKILYKNILRSGEKMRDKLTYELKKHLRIRLDGKTLRDVLLMERTVIPAADKTLAEPAPDSADLPSDKTGLKYRGKRPDHDQLPQEVQDLYVKNGEIYRKLRKTRETLRTLENAQPCDRYEYCKILSSLDKKYRDNWERYDHYTAAPPSIE